MPSLFSFFLLFSLLVFIHPQDTDGSQADDSFNPDTALDQLNQAQQAAKDAFAQNRYNLGPIDQAYNQYTISKNDAALSDIQNDVQKMKTAHSKLQNATHHHHKQNVSQPSQDILDMLNQKPHVLFDDSSSDSSDSTGDDDQVSADEQNEILLAQVLSLKKPENS